MKLLEHQGKLLLSLCGIRIPRSILVNNRSYSNLSFYKEKYKYFFMEHKSVHIKAQVLSHKRKEKGLIQEANDYSKSLHIIDNLYKSHPKVQELLIEETLSYVTQYYLAITFDTYTRSIILMVSSKGGSNVENNSSDATILPISITKGLYDYQLLDLLKRANIPSPWNSLIKIMHQLYNCFLKYDCTTCEINPLIRTQNGMFYALDAKITLDDNGLVRQEELLLLFDPEKNLQLSSRAIQARQIDKIDYRGVAGKTFIELDGDIAILASGGGASLIAMDALIQAGGKPANYAEYSGNPSREKVRKLTIITLKDQLLNGIFIVGGRANFTDIYETLGGFMDGLSTIDPLPKCPIVIRRAGPRDKEAFIFLQKKAKDLGLNVLLYGEETSITEAAIIMAEKSKEYKNDF